MSGTVKIQRMRRQLCRGALTGPNETLNTCSTNPHGCKAKLKGLTQSVPDYRCGKMTEVLDQLGVVDSRKRNGRCYQVIAKQDEQSKITA